jgi:SIR2-like domain
MVNWPESLVIELAARRCIVFLGAGASSSASRADASGEHPPNWLSFLRILQAGSNRGEPGDLVKAVELLGSKQYLDCAEILRSTCLHPADYNRLVGETLERYRPTEVHRTVESLDQKIVVTTNFDTLYEDHCRQGEARHGYSVINYYDEGLITRMRSPKRLILKAHGCVTVPEKTILSKSDFFKMRAEYPGFFKTLESLFLTHTLLFIGYSVTDPDIQLLLENASITAKSDHPHYALMATGLHPAIREAFFRTFNLRILEYAPANDHEEFLISLQDLAARVNEMRQLQS